MTQADPDRVARPEPFYPITITAPEPSLWYVHRGQAVELTGAPNTGQPTVDARTEAFIQALLNVAQARRDDRQETPR